LECDRKGSGYGIFGGYDFSPRYALELSHAEIGESSAKYNAVNLEAALSVTDLSLKYSRGLFGNSRWFAKLGVAYWRGEVEGWDVKLDDAGVRPSFALGMDWPFSQRFSARLEYQFLSDIGNDAMGRTDPHFLNLGITWHFSARDRGVETFTPASAEPVPLSSSPSRTSSTPASAPVAEVVVPAVVDADAEYIQPIIINDQIPRPLFRADSTVLQDARVLEPVAMHLMRYPNLLVRVVAHTDDGGSSEYNKQLSRRRAETVAEYLRWQGVAAERITTDGRGEDQPIADNSDHAGRALNRRVEFLFTDAQIRHTSEGVED